MSPGRLRPQPVRPRALDLIERNEEQLTTGRRAGSAFILVAVRTAGTMLGDRLTHFPKKVQPTGRHGSKTAAYIHLDEADNRRKFLGNRHFGAGSFHPSRRLRERRLSR